MKIKLYNYTGESDICNKIKNLSPVFDSQNFEFEIYGTFSPFSAEFVISNLYSVNYGCFLFAGLWYYGDVTISTTSKGLYTYHITVDPLTTAFYGGCMNVNAMILYNADVDELQQDPRIPFSEYTETVRDIKTDTSNLFTDWAVVLNTIYAGSNPNKFTGNNYNLTPDNIVSYMFLSGDDLGEYGVNATGMYSRFLRMASMIDTIPFLNLKSLYSCMLNAYIVPKRFSIVRPNPLPANHYVTLNSLPDSVLSEFTEVNVHPIEAVPETAKFDYIAIELPKAMNPTVSYTWDITAYKKYNMWSAMWSIFVPYCGSIQFIPEKTIPENSDFVGVDVSINYGGAFYTITLKYGYHDNEGNAISFKRNDNRIITPITETIPIPTNDSQSNAISQLIGNGISALSSALSGNPYKEITGAINLGINSVGAIGASMVGAGINTTGTNGGNPSRNNTDKNPYLYISYAPYETTQAGFAEKMGYPTNKVENLQNQPSGYIQTQNAILNQMGYPKSIIETAESICNSGFRKS